jgi:Tfp pilus assembly protein PilN
MKKTPKEAFGIFQDGQIIRMVHLSKDGADTYLLGMDSIQLERDWYKSDEATAGSADADFIPIDSQYMDADELDLNDISMDSEAEIAQPRMEVSPTTVMFSKFPLHQGVIALNVHENHILKDQPGLIKKKDLARFRKNNLSQAQIKAGHWHSCVIEEAGQGRHWLYTGPNLLLDALINYSKEANTRLYYQLADANDIALTDYYRFVHGSEASGLSLLVYLGHEYRKIFVFEDGKWVSTLPIHITQQFPEAEVIYSKLALALDSAQLGEPESIVLSGDLANRQLVEYMTAQSMSTKSSLLDFPNLIVTNSDNEEFTAQALAPYGLALALAYKAMNHEDPSFTQCTFLPNRIIDNQKELKVVWHGFIVLILVFVLVLYSTIQFQKIHQQIRQQDQLKTDLDFTLNRLRAENAIVEHLNAEIAKFQQISNIVGEILEGKNRWTEMFDILNSTFGTYRQSWISNLRQSGDQISITGITSEREYVSRLAARLPQSGIRRVTNSKIRDQVVWNFEIDFVLPEVDWMDMIASEYSPPPQPARKASPTRRSAPQVARSKSQETSQEAPPPAPKNYKFGILPQLEDQNTPGPITDELKQNAELAKLYSTFVSAINKGNMLEYRFIGHSLINGYPESELLPLVRWWLAYRLYLDREFKLANQILEPNLKHADSYHPYSMLMQARLDYATQNRRFTQIYESLIEQYPDSAASRQAKLDLARIEKEVIR